MQRTPSSRKRAAPGASPIMQQPAAPQANFDYSQMPQNADFSNFDFTQFPTDQSYQDASLNDLNNYASAINGSQAPTYGSNLAAVTPSTDLVRRTRNNQLAPPTGQQEQWNGYNTTGTMHGSGDEDEQELERKVALAKKDAQGKRKQIPPFVQKLSSFLDSGNTELIRWSDDGRSFIVIDEDEFARTLIPELFKHNNYASFVRQLNMYGFHKTVNITDGSLRQSEKARKGVKPPSMYSHPYFRRNRPDLLWLIQKPLAKTSAKRKRDGTVKADESDDESPGPDGKPPGELGLTSTGSDLATMPRNELSSVRRELHTLQQQQKYISDMITQLKKQNDSFYRQATQFQQLHDRHESSINAILTFLATFYSRSLDGHAGQNLVNMFSNMAQQNNQQHGSVVEDFTDAVPESNNQVQRFKRPQLLLPGPEAPQQPGTTQTASTSARSSISPVNESKRNRASSAKPSSSQPPQSISPQVKNDAPTPDLLNTVPESDQMMSLINSVNATNASSSGTAAPAWDFNSALNHYQNANGNAPLTPQQRDDMLAMMASQQGGSNGNNALVSPTPPAMPDLSQIKQSQQQLEMLTNMQRTQDDRVQELSRRLQPLSPTGTIPGIADAPDGGGFFDPTGAPGDFDPNSFIDFNNDNDLNFSFADTGNDVDWDFSNTGNANGNGSAGMNTGFDTGSDMFNMNNNSGQDSNQLLQPDHQQYDGGGRVESVSSAATSPAGTVEENQDGSASKRRRRS